MEALHIIEGFLTRIAALAGAAFCVFIAGACLMFFAHGPGKLALDKA